MCFLFMEYYFRAKRSEVICALFCGCPARGEQNGVKFNFITLAII